LASEPARQILRKKNEHHTHVDPGRITRRIPYSRAAEESVPASSNIGTADYPRIASDLRVTFRLKAPNARQVKLEGGAGLVKVPIEMERSEDGTWSVTTPPAVPGFHYYWFTVDGLRVNDPSSYAWFGWARETSGIEGAGSGHRFLCRKAGRAAW
jgi:hypothetical protein